MFEPQTCLSLLSTLQRHGLTQEVLEDWVTFVETRKSGTLTLQVHDGHFIAHEYYGKKKLRISHDVLTKVS